MEARMEAIYWTTKQIKAFKAVSSILKSFAPHPYEYVIVVALRM